VKAVISPIAEPESLPAPAPGPARLPPEWAEWAEEPGLAVRLEEGGAVRGSLHVVIVGRDEAWLEGLWVDPAARGRGVGRQLVAEAEGVARTHGAATVRTAVPARDYAAMAVAERTGYQRVTRTDVLVAGIEPGPIDIAYDARVAPAVPADAPALMALLGAAETLAAWRGLVPLGWRFRRLVPELLRGLIKDRRIVRSGEWLEGVAGFAVRGQTAVLSFLEGPLVQRQALYGAVAERARAAGAAQVVLFVPDASALGGIRASFAPHAWCPDGLIIVEKTLTATAPQRRPRTAR
jgi:GNAT superfamily N-acetyltransferase